MSRKTVGWGIALLVVLATGWFGTSAYAQGGKGQPNDWNRFFYYPYVYYPENFQPLQSYDNMYYRYPQNRQFADLYQSGVVQRILRPVLITRGTPSFWTCSNTIQHAGIRRPNVKFPTLNSSKPKPIRPTNQGVNWFFLTKSLIFSSTCH